MYIQSHKTLKLSLLGLAFFCSVIYFFFHNESVPIPVEAGLPPGKYKAKENRIPVSLIKPERFSIDSLTLDSQQDTQIDGRLRASNTGDLIIETGIVDLFNYFFTASGELTVAEIRNNIHQYIDAQLELKAADQAKALLEKYIAYNEAEQQFQQSLSYHQLETQEEFLSKMEELLDWRKNKRREIFSKNAEKLFQSEESAYDQFMLARMQLDQEGLSQAEAMFQLEKYISELPSELQETVQQQLNIKQQIALEVSSQALSEEDERALRREKEYSPQAQTALEELDKKNLDLERRVGQYVAFKQSLEEKNLSLEYQLLQAQRFKAGLFSELELKRLPYLEQRLKNP